MTKVKTKEEAERYRKIQFERAVDKDQETTHKSRPQAKLRFSSFGGKPKEYPVEPDRSKSFNVEGHGFDTFVPKEEYTRPPVDPNVRPTLPDLPSADLTRKYLYGYAEKGEPQSSYVAVNHRGVTYHLFNAKRMPLGRMAAAIAEFIRGKHKPGYDRKSYENGDKCIVVNMADPLLTGRKKQQKLYRHHTGYPGGLKEYTFKHVLATKPERIIYEAVRGMLPKNKLREQMIKQNLDIIIGPYHNYHAVGLPQFTDPVPKDLNEELGFDDLDPAHNRIIFSSDPTLPEELEGIPLEIDHSIGEPYYLKEKTHTTPKSNYKLAGSLKKSFKSFGRYKTHKL